MQVLEFGPRCGAQGTLNRISGRRLRLTSCHGAAVLFVNMVYLQFWGSRECCGRAFLLHRASGKAMLAPWTSGEGGVLRSRGPVAWSCPACCVVCRRGLGR